MALAHCQSLTTAAIKQHKAHSPRARLINFRQQIFLRIALWRVINFFASFSIFPLESEKNFFLYI